MAELQQQVVFREEHADEDEAGSSKESGSNNYKTAMCDRESGCTRSDCTFAHSEAELKKRSCSFGERCFRAFKHPGMRGDWCNRGDRVCTFFHPGETYDNFRARVTRRTTGAPFSASATPAFGGSDRHLSTYSDLAMRVAKLEKLVLKQQAFIQALKEATDTWGNSY
jgi:hypothetical protein